MSVDEYRFSRFEHERSPSPKMSIKRLARRVDHGPLSKDPMFPSIHPPSELHIAESQLTLEQHDYTPDSPLSSSPPSPQQPERASTPPPTSAYAMPVLIPNQFYATPPREAPFDEATPVKLSPVPFSSLLRLPLTTATPECLPPRARAFDSLGDVSRVVLPDNDDDEEDRPEDELALWKRRVKDDGDQPPALTRSPEARQQVESPLQASDERVVVWNDQDPSILIDDDDDNHDLPLPLALEASFLDAREELTGVEVTGKDVDEDVAAVFGDDEEEEDEPGRLEPRSTSIVLETTVDESLAGVEVNEPAQGEKVTQDAQGVATPSFEHPANTHEAPMDELVSPLPAVPTAMPTVSDGADHCCDEHEEDPGLIVSSRRHAPIEEKKTPDVTRSTATTITTTSASTATMVTPPQGPSSTSLSSDPVLDDSEFDTSKEEEEPAPDPEPVSDEEEIDERGTGWWLTQEMERRQRLRQSCGHVMGVAERIASLNDSHQTSIASDQATARSRDLDLSERLAMIDGAGSADQAAAAGLDDSFSVDHPSSTDGSPGPSRTTSMRPSKTNEDKSAKTQNAVVTPPTVRRLSNSREDLFDSMVGAVGSLQNSLERGRDPSDHTRRSVDDDDAGSDSTHTMIESLEALVSELESVATSSPSRSRSASVTGSVSGKESLASLTRSHDHIGSDMESSIGDARPIVIIPLDIDIGIPKGDVMLSLLNQSTETNWATRVQEGIWRGRTMRRNCNPAWLTEKVQRKPGQPSKGRTSVLIDVDEGCVVGGIDSLPSTQTAAMEHLKYDDFDDCLALYHDILQCYDVFFEKSFKRASLKSPQEVEEDIKSFKLCVGVCLHNIGLIHLLRGDYTDAFTYFERATMNRASSLGSGHSDHIVSLVRMAICRFAVEDFASAHTGLEEALSLTRGNIKTLADHRQLAEILNNLGCLMYMCGQTENAMKHLEEALDIQSFVAGQSLYAGSKFACHNISLNQSISKANIGLITLVTKDVSMSLEAFEAAIRVSHDRLILLAFEDEADAHCLLNRTNKFCCAKPMSP